MEICQIYLEFIYYSIQYSNDHRSTEKKLRVLSITGKMLNPTKCSISEHPMFGNTASRYQPSHVMRCLGLFGYDKGMACNGEFTINFNSMEIVLM